jgi:NMT1/THI5 like
MNFTRRKFVGGLTLAGTAGQLGVRPETVSAEPLPETTRLKLTFQSRSICTGVKYFRELLQTEGFTDLQYANEESTARRLERLASGESDIDVTYAATLIIRIDAGDPIVVLAGAHVGCFELFATNGIRTIRDLKGKAVAIDEFGGTRHVYIASMATYVGLDPRKDIKWVTHSRAEAIRLLAAGKIDALIGVPPEPQELRAKKDCSRGGQQHDGPALVSVLLLRGCGEPGIRPHAPGGDQAGTARDAEGSGPLRSGAGTSRAAARRKRSHSPLRVRGPDHEGGPLRQVAGV